MTTFCIAFYESYLSTALGIGGTIRSRYLEIFCFSPFERNNVKTPGYGACWMYIICCITYCEGPLGVVAEIFFLEWHTMHGSYYTIILFSVQLTVASATVVFNMPVNLPVRISQFLLLKTFELIVLSLYWLLNTCTVGWRYNSLWHLRFCSCLGSWIKSSYRSVQMKDTTVFSIETSTTMQNLIVNRCFSVQYFLILQFTSWLALLVVRVNLRWTDYYICIIPSEYGVIYRGPSFLAVVWFGSFSVSKLALFLSFPVSPVELTDVIGGGGRGGGEVVVES